jgi:putative transposase
VINRGNARSEVFHTDGDYQAFMDLLSQASQRISVHVLAYCLMPNHFHLALWPSHGEEKGVRNHCLNQLP